MNPETEQETNNNQPMLSQASEQQLITPSPTDKEGNPIPVPLNVNLNQFREHSLLELHDTLEALPVRPQAFVSKAQLIYNIVSFYCKLGADVTATGILELNKDGNGTLRDPKRSFKPSPDDVNIGIDLIRKSKLQAGQKLQVKIRKPRPKDRFLFAQTIQEIENVPKEEVKPCTHFDKLTPLFPEERIMLDGGKEGGTAVRIVDLIAPLGKGQRGIIVAPPRGGKTILLKQIAQSIVNNHPEIELIILLLDERPEEVTEFEETLPASVFSSTFDESPARHAQVADLVLERAKRLVEQGKDVVILLDSLTRLARGHNNAIKGGPIGSGGVNPQALQKSGKFFGTARNIDEGGSLTILATALVETESRLDEVIFEEFKGKGNMEIKLDQELAERRIFPAIHIPRSGTRNDDRLYHNDELRKVIDMRKYLTKLPVGEAIQFLNQQLEQTQNNTEFLLRGLR